MRRSTREMWEVNKYLWLCLLFAALYVPWAARHGRLAVPVPAAYSLLLLAVVNGAARSWCGWRRGGFNDARLSWLFTLADIALISIAVRITGGLQSDLWLLYFVLLVSESLFADTRQTTLVNVLLVAGYAAATWPAHGRTDYLLVVATRMFFMVLVGSFGLRLTTDREKRDREVARLNEQVAASDERARIAREIHDSLGHALVAAILRLELSLRVLRKGRTEEAEALLKEEIAGLRAAWNEGRDLVFHLRPWERDGADLPETLRRHVGRFAERTGLAVDLRIAAGPWELPRDVEFAVTRILQEALTNVAKHARAGRVAISLERVNGQVRCRVEDDGVGFDAEASGLAHSFGLSAMRERAEKLGGGLTLASRPGAGTTVEVCVPE